MIRYSLCFRAGSGVWQPEHSRVGMYEIMRWRGPRAIVVQTNIHTREKAEAALQAWQQREASKRVQQH